MAFSYQLVTHDRAGREHSRPYTGKDPLAPASIVLLAGRYWLVERLEQTTAHARPARYRLTLRHPDGRLEAGAFRRFQTDAPTVGHQLTTLEAGAPISWAVVEQRLARDEACDPFLELIAERDYAESESLPNHELEHTLDRERDDTGAAAAVLARAKEAQLAIELVGLAAGEAPDWDESTSYLDSLILAELEDDLIEQCGVDTRHDPPDTWLDRVKRRLNEDLDSRLGDIAQVMLERGTPAVRRHAGWLLAIFAMAKGDAEAARSWLRTPTDSDARTILPRFPLDIADDVMLARIALATHDNELAQLALSAARRRVESNPGIESIAATAAHVRGLIERNQSDLWEAVALFERAPRPLELAAALEDLGAELTATDRDTAVDVLGRALALYTELGATWDARRVRSRLRELGVRRRLVPAEPETSGWAALTASERTIARLVAEGLTNREVAERLFVSPHTVNSHLRHVFSKLGINSRVELARLARDYEMA